MLNDKSYFWCIRNRLKRNLPLTSNSVEGWHRRLQSLVGSKHPAFLKVLHVLKGEFVRAQRIFVTGTKKKVQKKAIGKRNAILKIIQEHEEGTLLDDSCFIYKIALTLIRRYF